MSLYVSVLQPTGTFAGVGLVNGSGALASLPGFAAEDQFIQTVFGTTQTPIVQYGRVAGSIIFEDE